LRGSLSTTFGRGIYIVIPCSERKAIGGIRSLPTKPFDYP
jgi:hypothetical protein